MKGMEMPILFVVAIIIGMITVIGVVLFLNEAVNDSNKNIDMITRHSELCSIYGDAKCVEKNVAPKYQPGFSNDMINACKKLGYISPFASCVDFDRDCGRICCKSCPPLESVTTTISSTTTT